LGYVDRICAPSSKGWEVPREGQSDGSGAENGRSVRRPSSGSDHGAQEKEDWGNLMSYTEARSHFEKARINPLDKGMVDLLDGLKHLSHAIEEDFRAMEKSIRDIRDVQSSKQIPSSFT